MIDQETISRVVDVLREAAKPRQIILFGSHAWRDTPGNVLCDAATEGEVIYETA